MATKRTALPGALAIGASGLGLFFAAFSTHDYALHLDRQLHATHCSFVPGLVDAAGGDNACTTAMYSAYSAILRDAYWGGVPISLFALGAYAAYFGLALHLLLSHRAASVRFFRGFGIASAFPLIASGVMFTISLTQLGGQFCKLCVGLYVASILLLASGIVALRQAAGPAAPAKPRPPADPEATSKDAEPWGAVAEGSSATDPVSVDVPRGVGAAPRLGGPAIPVAILAVIGIAAAAPAAVWVATLPTYDKYVRACGKLPIVTEKTGALVKVPTTKAVQPALTFEDPLCPTCRAFHQRLQAEGIFDQLDYTLSLFPLDNECNWMLDRALHPGACTVSRALLCADETGKGRLFLDWAYEDQDALAAAGKAGKEPLLAKIRARFPGLDACIDAPKTKQRLDAALRFAVDNKIKVSTPQLFLGDQRVCDEDTDLGLRYAIGKLAPKVK
jgi:protein-disulfide isomerase